MGSNLDHSIIRLKHTLLNLTLRLREAYIARGLREERAFYKHLAPNGAKGNNVEAKGNCSIALGG